MRRESHKLSVYTKLLPLEFQHFTQMWDFLAKHYYRRNLEVKNEEIEGIFWHLIESLETFPQEQ